MAQTTAPQVRGSTSDRGPAEMNSPYPNEVQPKPPEDDGSTRPEFKTSLSLANEQNDTFQTEDHEDQDFFKKMRGWLMIVAILAAGSTYQAGLNPPGSFWQNDDDHPVLHDTFFRRYEAFYYCNAISFLSSLVIIIFLMNKRFYRHPKRIRVLKITMVLDLFSFIAAYAIGSSRRVKSSICIFLLVGGVFLYVILFALYYTVLRNIAYKIPAVKPCRAVCGAAFTV